MADIISDKDVDADLIHVDLTKLYGDISVLKTTSTDNGNNGNNGNNDNDNDNDNEEWTMTMDTVPDSPIIDEYRGITLMAGEKYDHEEDQELESGSVINIISGVKSTRSIDSNPTVILRLSRLASKYTVHTDKSKKSKDVKNENRFFALFIILLFFALLLYLVLVSNSH